MKILIATIGSRGDVQPYINLAQGLLAAGHEVSLASNPTLSGLAAMIRRALDDPGMRARAAEIGSAIRCEPDGVSEAVGIFERLGEESK